MSLKLLHVSGGYSNLLILRDVSFEIKKGEVLALIGLNGAGKSTTIKHILGLLTPVSGKITIDDQTISNDFSAYEKKIAYVPEQPDFYRQLTLQEHLDLVMEVYRSDDDKTRNEAKRLLKMFRLEDKLDWLPVHFSKGMQQKMMLTAALMLDCELLIIDEPFVGLDPVAIDDLIKLINEKKKSGKSVLMSTHILANAQNLADQFVLLNQGRVQAQGNLDEVRQTVGMPKASLEEIYLKLAKGEFKQ
ncbi:ABC transporter ATP-binding protein [Xylocopilactobacillus apicola]|uniref:ABC transporter ATP-binding protein n=1 Tax=Xylocopilactobacillus apicola TaxID=2932184 RepID=A0AAU9D410_9LACO|nr:ABC transporter ATP-binding protein [Xylocopilactobacillus apicola]BDR58509.1 ABC transporter ATP-binding protein [Xylocopilactobacillus apicola]